MDFFYDGQIRRYVTQFMRVFIGFKYQAGDGDERLVPVMYGDLTRQVASIIKDNSENKMLLSAGSFVFLAATLVMTIGTSFEFPRTTTNVKVVSGIFFAVALISNLIFTFIKFSVPSYVIINGILLLVFILIAYSINRVK